MTEKRKSSEPMLGINLDFYTIGKDVLKNWWVILVLALAVSLVAFVQVNKNYSPTYTIEATYVVTAKGVNNSVYDNLSSAQDTATKFSQIINSATLRNIVSKELGTPVIPGVIMAENVPETNLITLKVTAQSPELAHKVIKAIMDNYPEISEYLVGNAIMDVLMAPMIPTEPNEVLNIFRPVRNAFFITILLLVLAVAVNSYLKDTIRRGADVEKKLDSRLLGSICHEEKNKTLMTKFKKNNMPLLMTNPIVSFRYAEMTRKACRKVQNRMEEHGAKTLLITSCLENEGKSTVAANLALSLAHVGHKVLLMDLDLRRPSQYKIFDCEKEAEVKFGHALKYGVDKAEKLILSQGDGLDVIFNSWEYSKSTEMLTTGHLEQLLDELKQRYDFIIIDTPPMAYVADAEEIAHMVDASLVVVREHIASARDINDMLDVLNGSKSKVIGCIFNDAHGSMSRTLFGGYGYGYGYGHMYEYGYGYGYGYGKYYGHKNGKNEN